MKLSRRKSKKVIFIEVGQKLKPNDHQASKRKSEKVIFIFVGQKLKTKSHQAEKFVLNI